MPSGQLPARTRSGSSANSSPGQCSPIGDSILAHLEITMELFANGTRRSALAALAGGALLPRLGHAAKKATAFALIGDRYHNSDYIRTGLIRTIAKQLGVTIDFTDETSLLNAETLDGYKL